MDAKTGKVCCFEDSRTEDTLRRNVIASAYKTTSALGSFLDTDLLAGGLDGVSFTNQDASYGSIVSLYGTTIQWRIVSGIK